MVVGGGRALSLGNCFFQPSVLVGANTDMQLAHEETFGPVAPIIRWGNYRTPSFCCHGDTVEEEEIGMKKSYLTFSFLQV